MSKAVLSIFPGHRRGYTVGMTQKVGPKGQVVIPKQIRDALGIEPGDEVECTLDGRAVRIVAARSTGSLMGSFRGMPLTQALEADRRSEP